VREFDSTIAGLRLMPPANVNLKPAIGTPYSRHPACPGDARPGDDADGDRAGFECTENQPGRFVEWPGGTRPSGARRGYLPYWARDVRAGHSGCGQYAIAGAGGTLAAPADGS